VHDGNEVSTTVILMGVSGVGKSSVAAALRRSLGWPFAEGDDFHPASNVEKMRRGTALDDEDRWPWLAAIAAWIGAQEASDRDCIVSCSALKSSYRDALRRGHSSAWFVHLAAPADVIATRLGQRAGHFMPASLLASQLQQLEPLRPEEPGVTVAATGTADETAAAIEALLRSERRLR
jgi:gluconokinase